jgi:type II secretory pathway pseudopilin PulG
LRSFEIPNHKLQNRQSGYIMIMLMLALALITIALLTALPAFQHQVQRDREEEMQHRGTAYMRAIKAFYTKFGRYPTRIEELENTNNLKFLRRRYTDPMNIDPNTHKERDFKFLHQQDIPLSVMALMGQMGGQIPGQIPGGAGGGGAMNANQISQLVGQAGNAMAAAAGGALGGQTSGLQGATNLNGTPVDGEESKEGSAAGPTANSDAGDPNSSSPTSHSSSNSSSGSSSNSQTFGGGPILGVASMSKKKSIRVFADKNHYNDWLFIYMQSADRGGLLKGPFNPNLQAGNLGGLTPQQMNSGTSGFGSSSGSGSGFGQTGSGSGFGGGQNQNPQPPQPAPTQPPQQ